MPKGFKLNLDDLHARLWDASDRLGRVKVVQKDLAVELGITKFTMSRIVALIVKEGRIRQISRSKHRDGVFLVVDPAVWEAPDVLPW